MSSMLQAWEGLGHAQKEDGYSECHWNFWNF